MKSTPTKTQSEWIKKNYVNIRNKDIAEKFIISEKKVAEWLKILGLKKERVFAGRKKKGKKEKYVNNPIMRLSNEYSNVTREQHIDRILNMQL